MKITKNMDEDPKPTFFPFDHICSIFKIIHKHIIEKIVKKADRQTKCTQTFVECSDIFKILHKIGVLTTDILEFYGYLM